MGGQRGRKLNYGMLLPLTLWAMEEREAVFSDSLVINTDNLLLIDEAFAYICASMYFNAIYLPRYTHIKMSVTPNQKCHSPYFVFDENKFQTLTQQLGV